MAGQRNGCQWALKSQSLVIMLQRTAAIQLKEQICFLAKKKKLKSTYALKICCFAFVLQFLVNASFEDMRNVSFTSYGLIYAELYTTLNCSSWILVMMGPAVMSRCKISGCSKRHGTHDTLCWVCGGSFTWVRTTENVSHSCLLSFTSTVSVCNIKLERTIMKIQSQALLKPKWL